MNEPIPPLTPFAPTSTPDYKDRSTGLLVFGILTTIMGVLTGLLALLMLVGLAAARANPNIPPTPAGSILVIFGTYAGLATILIWLGIGSIKARRWARALLVIFCWAWLIMGIFAVVIMGFILPKTLANISAQTPPGQPAPPPGVVAGMMVFMFLFLGVFFVVLPALWAFFYSSRHVKATCEARDPVTRWTDACPLPVLALSLLLFLGVPMLLAAPIMYHGVVPFFGMLLSGIPGSLWCLAMAALWAWCGYRLYKLDVLGWWLTLAAFITYGVSAAVTFARHDMIEMYQKMGYPQAQIDQIQQMGVMTGHNMEWMMAIIMVPWTGYILFIKKYFPAKA